MPLAQSQNTKIQYLKWMDQAGLEDALFLNRETAEKVLTEQRMRIVRHLTENEVSSTRDLARQLERNVSNVSQDLNLLFEAGIIDYEEEGRSKRPTIAHKNVMIKPVVFQGGAFPEDD